jgi:hypothetical protein
VQANQTSDVYVAVHFIEKANGITHEYAWPDKHPDVCSMGLKIGLKSDIYQASVL